MTDMEAKVFESLSRGRLMFPFKDELAALRKKSQAGPLIDSEAERMTDLQGAFEVIKVKDRWFHSAMEGGDTIGAQKIAEEALAVLQELDQ